ncbi:MAG TPA: integrase arm-type DNA-binding domain-containing protein [Casimicrobiaceae bacterium]|nr:integrase arm-type DNA-binding domain-containing protein [Casimicrobiaceae bacterium]
MPLTTTAIRNSKPGKKPYRKYDRGGLYLEITPAGSYWWRFAYRFGGKRKLLSLGVLQDVSLAEARQRRDEARRLLARSVDPSAARQAAKREAAGKAANSFEAVAREWYGKHSRTWVASHASDVMRRLEGNLFPDIGATSIMDLAAPELLAAIRKIEHRGAYDLAHRVLQVAGQVLRYGVASGRCLHDLSKDLRRALTPRKKKSQAAVKPEELPDLLRAIDGYDTVGDLQTKLALKLLALTFVRTSELTGAQWSEFDLDRKEPTWTVPGERMKMKVPHVVPLSRQVIKILNEARALAGDSPYVFPGRNRDAPMSNNTMLFALYRLGYKGKMTGHGFRAVASTILNEAGFRPDVIERQLAHAERNAVRAAYHRAEYLPERHRMMQQWADMVESYLPEDKIIPIKRAASRRD